MEDHKICRVCGESLPLYCFNKDSIKKCGYSNRCKNCLKKYRVYLKSVHNPNTPVATENFSVNFY